MRLHEFSPTCGWTNPVCWTLLTPTAKRYALPPPEFTFAAAGAGTISVLRTFEAATTSIRRTETSLNGDKPQLVGAHQRFGGILIRGVRICPQPRLALVDVRNSCVCRGLRLPHELAGLHLESRQRRAVAAAAGVIGGMACRRSRRRPRKTWLRPVMPAPVNASS